MISMWRLGTYWGFMLLAAGCHSQLPPPTDAQSAERALVVALDHWQAGTPLDVLQQQQPPVYFNDELWRSGQTLESYQLLSNDANGQGRRCGVQLNLMKTPRAQRTVFYQVDTQPAWVIVQQP